PGHGTSSHTSFTWESASATVHSAAAWFWPEKPVLIGLSLGAATAMYAAQRQPNSFAGLILSGAGVCWNDRYVRSGMTVAAALGAFSASVGRREPLAHAAGIRGREIVTAARTVDVAPAQLWRAARELAQFDARNTPPPPIPSTVIVLTDDRRMPPGLQRALVRYLGCPYVDVDADHDAPVRHAARFSDAVQTALMLLGDVDPPRGTGRPQ
ncbi:MAG: hypothetical protein QOD39_2590, partial [Mycobacterium sp.]|nr:hypothetical protein [Mycobacterium sp.]